MMGGFFSDHEKHLISRFEAMLKRNQLEYFDSQELVEITAYYIDLGKLNKARKALDLAHEFFPKNFDLQLKEAEYYLFREDVVRASNLLEALYEIYPDHVEVLILSAKLCSLKGAHHLAVSLLAKALVKAEDKGEIYGILGMEYYNLNQYRKAIRFYAKSLAFDPDNESDFFNALRCFEALEEPTRCIAFIERFINRNPYHYIAWNQLGLCYERAHHYEDALWAYDYATVAHERFIGAYYAKAAVLEKMHRFEAAIEVYADLSELLEFPVFSWYKASRCSRRMSQFEEALGFLHLATLEDRDQDSIWGEMSLLYLKSGAFEKALQHAHRAAERNPKYSGYWKRIAYLNTRLKHPEGAQRAYRKLLEMNVRDRSIWRDYALSLIDSGAYRQAIALLERRKPETPPEAMELALLACAHFFESDLAGSKAYMKQALQLDEKVGLHVQKRFPLLAQSLLFDTSSRKRG